MRVNSAVVVLVAAAIFPSVVCATGYRPKLGDLHPEFTLPDISTGKPISLSDFRGKKVLLIQFASWGIGKVWNGSFPINKNL
jgi:hypothetical protein